MKFINTYIAPWVLPKQVFPIHCVWKPQRDLSRIEVIIPKGYELADTLNFTEYRFNKIDNTITINAADLKSNNYFGVILRYPHIIQDIEKRDGVLINFIGSQKEKSLSKLTLETRIIRPKLELLRFPKEIIIADNTNPKDLIKLEILHKGFGTANLSLEVMHSGVDISKTKSLYFQVLKETIERILKIYEEPLESQMIVDIDDHLLKDIADNLFKAPFQENLPFELSKEDKELLREILKDESKKEAVYRVVYSSLRSLLFAALLYYGDRHPVEDIKVIDGKVVATMKERIDELNVRVSYYDSFENEYPPLEAKIRVLDRRSFDKPRDFEAPINIVWKKDVMNLED